MKKLIVMLSLFLTLPFIFSQSIFAAQTDFLPGGKNYLSMQNLSYQEDKSVTTVSNILVKSGTDYTFSFNREYEGGPDGYTLLVSLYTNETLVEELEISSFTGDEFAGEHLVYTHFNTGLGVNYLSMRIIGLRIDQPDNLTGIQLEEGVLPTPYENYFSGSMIDTTSPYFQSAGKVISYVDHPITTSEIKASLVAVDVIDGDVSDSVIVVTDNYTDQMHLVGTYSIVFQAKDLSGNETELEIIVEVVDILKPVFAGPGTLLVPYPRVESIEDIKALLSASDNYDGDISGDIILVEDEYTDNASIIGDYELIFSVEDTSGNIKYHSIIVSVLDEEGPIITGESSIHIGYNQYLTELDVLSRITVKDNYDKDIELVITKNTYEANKNTIGQYEIVLSASDSSDNKTDKIIVINVIDEIGPAIYFDMSVIQIYSDTVMELPDFALLLTKTNELDSERDYLITVKYDSYRKNAEKPGIYQLSLRFEDEYGKVYDKDFEIKVLAKNPDDVYLSQKNIQAPFFEKYKMYFMFGGVGFTLIASNLTWFILYKKSKN